MKASFFNKTVVAVVVTVAMFVSGVFAEEYEYHNGHMIEYAPDEVIVKFKPGAQEMQIDSIAEKFDVALVRTYQFADIEVWKLAQETNILTLCHDLGNQPEIEYAEPNYILYADIIPNDPRFDSLWGLDNTGQSGGTVDADIDATLAWNIETGNNIVVAVIDTGVDYTHEDLAANMWRNPGETPNNGIDDDRNGYVDDVYGMDACNGDGDPMDDHGHGTHCAGTIGAVGNNGVGVAGVCWHAKIMACKFLSDDGSGFTADAIECIEYAVANGAWVLNNSWGGGGYSQALKDAIESANRANVLFCAAAGNDGYDTDVYPHYPSSFNNANIVSVASSTRYESRSSFSNYGSITVDLFAPGSSILSTVPGGYATMSGTSMATPHCSGAAALILSRYPSLSVQQLKYRLLNNVDLDASYTGRCVSEGRLNVKKALDGSDDRPVNDDFSSAVTLSANSGNTSGDNNNATVENGEPNHAGRGPYNSVWWKFTPSQNGSLDINTHGSGFDTVLAVYRGSSLNNLVELDSNDDDGSPGNCSGLTGIALLAGTTYRIAVAGYGSTSEGDITLQWTFTPGGDVPDVPGGLGTQPGGYGEVILSWNAAARATGYRIYYDEDSSNPPFSPSNDGSPVSGSDVGNVTSVRIGGLTPRGTYYFAVKAYNNVGLSDYSQQILGIAGPNGPGNDNFNNAVALSGNTGNINGNNDNATVESGEPNHAGRGPYNSVWWKFTPSQDGILDVNTHGSGFDTVLAVYRGSSVNNLVELDSNDDDGSSGRCSGLRGVSLRAWTTYHIVVAGYHSSSDGDITLQWNISSIIELPIDDIIRKNGKTIIKSTKGGLESYFSDGWEVEIRDKESGAMVDGPHTMLKNRSGKRWRYGKPRGYRFIKYNTKNNKMVYNIKSYLPDDSVIILTPPQN